MLYCFYITFKKDKSGDAQSTSANIFSGQMIIYTYIQIDRQIDILKIFKK